MACPEGRRRNSLAVYYYSLDRLPDDDYQGMQRSVYWLPTTEADHAAARAGAERAAGLIERLHGRRFWISASTLPFPVPGFDGAGRLCLGLFDPAQLDPAPREALLQHLDALRPKDFAARPEAFAERYAPFAWIAASEDLPPTAPDAWLVLWDRHEGTMHLLLPGHDHLLFCGYVEEDLAGLERASGSA